MTEEQAKGKVLDLARDQIGVHETGTNITKYATDYDYDAKLYGFDMNGYPWCAYFISWLFCEAFGYELGSSMIYQYSGCSGAACAAAAGYFQQHGAFTNIPEPGSIIFFYVSGGINHQGIVETVTGDTITTIEGNSSDQVKRNTYSRTDPSIAGYGIPRWKYAESYEEGTETDQTKDTETEPCTLNEAKSQTMSEGNTGNNVKAAQALLNVAGGYELDVDGEFGPLTKTATVDLQIRAGLDPDGIIGSETKKILKEYL